MEWVQRITYQVGDTVMSVTKVTKEKPGWGVGGEGGGVGKRGEGTLWRRETAPVLPRQQVKEGGFVDEQKVTQVILPMGIVHQKSSLSHIT